MGLMTTEKPVPRGQEIEWKDFLADGGETPRRGEVWDYAPSVAGVGRAYWVIPTDRDGRPIAVLVAVTTRRHQAGAVGRNGRYRARAGRWVDVGEAYREIHPGSRVSPAEAAVEPLSHVRPRKQPDEFAMSQARALFEGLGPVTPGGPLIRVTGA
jgi:hypothetical protein